jgi:hypothetical protein
MGSSRPASRIEVFDVLVAAGTSKAAAVETDTSFLPGELVALEVDIPDGHAGLTGFMVLHAHGQVIPRTAGAWIVGNDDHLNWDLIGYGNSGSFSVLAYNTDIFPHTFHFRFLVADFAHLLGATDEVPATTPLIV